MEEGNRYFIKQFIKSALEALEAADYTISGSYFGLSVNRSYYAFFYTASALLLTKGLTRNKHIGVLAAFQRRGSPFTASTNKSVFGIERCVS